MAHVNISDASDVAQPIAVDVVAGEDVQLAKPVYGDAGSATMVSTANPLPVTVGTGVVHVDDNSGSITVDDGGGAVSVDDNGGSITVDDGAGSITVDAPVGTPVWVRLSDGSAAFVGQKTAAASVPVVLASDQSVIPVSDNSGSLTVDDGGGSVTVDGTVAVSTGPAAARTTDSIAAALATDAIMNGTTVLTPLFQSVTASASGATTIVALVASKKIRVLSLVLVGAAAVTVNLQSHTTTATKTGSFPFAANGGIVLPFNPVGWFETVAGEALDINLGGAVAVGGQLVYTTL